MPLHRTHFFKIHFAESDKKNQEHEKRKNEIKNRIEEISRMLQYRSISKYQIQYRSGSH
uniref:hypothetical protein n=1 Tax=Phocaeicola oris TaxID=2896850 RepID=UPI0038B2D06B